MQQTIEISDNLAVLIQDYLQKNLDRTIASLIQEALVQKLEAEQLENQSIVNEVVSPDPHQIEKFMALSGIVKQAPRHSDENAEDYRLKQIVLDAGALIALFHERDRHHAAAKLGFRQLFQQNTTLPIIFEVYKWLVNQERYDTAYHTLTLMLSALHPVFLSQVDVVDLQRMITTLPGWGGSLEDATVTLIAQRYRCPVWTMNYRDFGTIQRLEFWVPG